MESLACQAGIVKRYHKGAIVIMPRNVRMDNEIVLGYFPALSQVASGEFTMAEYNATYEPLKAQAERHCSQFGLTWRERYSEKGILVKF